MKKNIILIAIVLVFAGVYVVYFTDWFRPKTIQIFHTIRPTPSGRGGPAVPRLAFGLGDYYELTEVKVVPLAEWQTNKNIVPLWHLISDEGSDDVNRFFYGENISGMDPAIEGVRPQLLQPGITYRLFVAAGKIKGWHDFQIGSPSSKISTSK